MKLHYGHFFVNTLARLWSFSRSVDRCYDKIIFHSFCNPDAWFKQPFIRDIFEVLGILRKDVLVFNVPTRIDRMTINHPSFQEQAFIHKVFAELCNSIGQRVLGARAPQRSDRPLYISKTAIKTGVGRIVNESIIEEALATAGFDIVYPETLAFADQVALFSERRHIMGCLGSAMHTSIFRPPGADITIVCPREQPLSNFCLMDKANGNKVRYLFAPGSRFIKDPGSVFLTNLELSQPAQIAEDLIALSNMAQPDRQ